MEDYRKKLERRVRLYGACCGLVPIGLLAVNWLSRHTVGPALSEHDMGFVHGFAVGISLVVIAISVYQAIRIYKALKDEALLRKLYIDETDERAVFIQNKVGSTGIRLAVFLLVFAAIIACYFNMTVAYSLIGAALGLSLIMAGFKFYYKNKY